jgi:hypothetical protein
MPKLALELKPSARLGVFFGLLYAGALLTIGVGIVQGWLPWWLAFGAASLWCWSLRRVWSRHVSRRHPDAVVAIEWDWPGGSWVLTTRANLLYETTIHSQGALTTAFSLLNFTDTRGKKQFTVLIVADACDKHQLRRLQVGLRLRPSSRGSSWFQKRQIKS